MQKQYFHSPVNYHRFYKSFFLLFLSAINSGAFSSPPDKTLCPILSRYQAIQLPQRPHPSTEIFICNLAKYKGTLNKSRLKSICTSCLHIFRQPAQKILAMRQHSCGLFGQPDEKSDCTICANDLISISLKIPRLTVNA